MKDNFILVTGGAGYIGSHIVNLLIKKNLNIIIVDNLSSGKISFINKKAKFFKLNLLNKNIIFKKLKNFNILSIIHLAAYSDVIESKKKPKKYLKDNLLMTKNLLDFAVSNNIKNFIFSSTAAVYGNVDKIKVEEKDPKKPISNYGLGKLYSEKLIKKYSLNNKLNYVLMRYFNVVGSDYKRRIGPIKSGTLFKNLSSNIVNSKYQIKIYGKNFNTKDGSAIRDFIDVTDLAEIHYLILKKIKNLKKVIINCGYAKPNSVIEIVKYFSTLIKRKIKINTLKKRLGEIDQIYADNSLLLKILPRWKRKISTKQSVYATLKWEEYIKKNKI